MYSGVYRQPLPQEGNVRMWWRVDEVALKALEAFERDARQKQESQVAITNDIYKLV